MTLRTSSAAGALLDFDRVASMLQEQATQMRRESGTATNPLVLAHPQSGKASGKKQSNCGKSEQLPHLCSHHGRNWTHDTADCRTLQAAAGKQPTKPPTGNKPVAALITSPSGPESDEERDEEGLTVLTVDRTDKRRPYHWSQPCRYLLHIPTAALPPLSEARSGHCGHGSQLSPVEGGRKHAV